MAAFKHFLELLPIGTSIPTNCYQGEGLSRRGIRELPVELPQKEATGLEFGVEAKGTRYKESHADSQGMSAFITQEKSHTHLSDWGKDAKQHAWNSSDTDMS